MPHDLHIDPATVRKGGRRAGQANRKDLTDRQVKAATRDCRCSKNLWLQVSPTGSKSWVMEWSDGGKRHWMGLGSYPVVSLAEARDKVLEHRRTLAAGEDPRKPAATHPFREVAALWIEKAKTEWSNERYSKQVPRYLAQHVYPQLGDMDVAAIKTEHVYNVLHPIWTTIHPTAVVIRGYIEQVLNYAKARGWRTGDNAALWKANLEFILSSKVHTPEEHPSLHHSEIAAFMTVLRTLDGAKFRALELLIHSGLRSKEVAGARWDEIDFEQAVWSLPGIRMKERTAHSVPLTAPAVAMLQGLAKDGELVFGRLGDNDLREALAAVVKAAGRVWKDKDSGKPVGVHGMRAALSTWGRDHSYDETMIEVALAHAVGTETARRYQRSDMIERRAGMMAAWSEHLSSS
jgi:integrase